MLDCLQEEPAAPDADLRVRLPSAAWASLVEEATRLGVAPLLFYRLKTLEPREPIPAQVEQRLGQIYYTSTARNVRLYHELGGVLRALREEGIPVIVLKGAHLAQVVYVTLYHAQKLLGAAVRSYRRRTDRTKTLAWGTSTTSAD